MFCGEAGQGIFPQSWAVKGTVAQEIRVVLVLSPLSSPFSAAMVLRHCLGSQWRFGEFGQNREDAFDCGGPYAFY